MTPAQPNHQQGDTDMTRVHAIARLLPIRDRHQSLLAMRDLGRKSGNDELYVSRAEITASVALLLAAQDEVSYAQ